MKKIRLKNDVSLMGYGIIKKGTMFKVKDFNSRFVYVELSAGCIARFARKRDCDIVY